MIFGVNNFAVFPHTKDAGGCLGTEKNSFTG
jgi:hypothetical protein